MTFLRHHFYQLQYNFRRTLSFDRIDTGFFCKHAKQFLINAVLGIRDILVRIRIRIWMQIREAQKHTDPDADLHFTYSFKDRTD